MKIAYFLHWNATTEINPVIGVFEKILKQISLWSSNDVTVAIFILSRQESIGMWSSQVGNMPLFLYRYQGRLDRFKKLSQLVDAILEWNPDIVYLRQELYYPPLERLTLNIPVVMEINSDDLAECSLGPIHYYWYHRLTRRRLLSKAKGMIFVTDELALMPCFSVYCQSKVVITNGIELLRYPSFPAPNHSTPRLVFIAGSKRHWHGVDKILYLARQFPHWQFDLIGLTADDLDGDLPPNILTHGLLKRSKYEPIMANADVGIGTLALHRIDLNEACVLKVREYLAYGIPTIIGYHDTDFPKPVPYILKIPNTPNNIIDSLQSIEEFVQTARGRRVAKHDINHLDVNFKEKQRIEFFQKCIDSKQNNSNK